MKHFMSIVLCLLLSLSAGAQQLTVKSFQQANQFIPTADQVRDWDNEPCALIKIQGAMVDSVSGAFDVVKHAAETWVYMTNGDKKLTIFKQGYETLDVTFERYGYSDVKSNRVYLLTIQAPVLQKKKAFIGVRGGMNMANADLGSGYGKGDMVYGFTAGVDVRYLFTDAFGLATGLQFTTLGYKYSDVERINEKGDYTFVDLPVQLMLNWNFSKPVGLQLLAGGYASLNVGGKTTRDYIFKDDKFSDDYQTFQYGVQGGLELVFIKRISLGAYYQYGLGDYKNQNINIHLAVLF